MISSRYWLRRHISLGFFIWLAVMLFAWMPTIEQHLPAQEQPTLEQIQQAVQKLGADRFQLREEASLFLWRAGRIAEKSLVEAAKSSDGEIAFRAQAILEKFRFGIYPDTPPDVIVLIESFRSGDFSQKQNVLAELNQKKEFRTMLALLRTEPDEEQRQSLARNVINRDSVGVVTVLLTEGDFEQVEDLLQSSASFDTYGSHIRDYATLLLLTGKLDANIEQLQQEIDDESHEKTSRQQRLILAHFYAIKGDYEKAKLLITSEKKYDADNFLLADLHYRMQNWSALVEVAPGDQGLENLGFSAAYNRLAGNRAGFEQAIADLKQFAREQPDRSFMYSEALMINHRWQDAVDLLIENQNVTMAFRLLCEQSQFEAALALVEFDYPHEDALTWWQKIAFQPGQPDDPHAARLPFGVCLLVAKTMHALGEHEQAIALLSELAKVPPDEKGMQRYALISTEMELGLRDVAFEHADQALQIPETRNTILYGLFQGQSPLAQTLYDSFQWHSLDVSAHDLDDLIRPEKDRALPEAELRKIVKQVESWVNQMPPGEDPFGSFNQMSKAMEKMGNLALIHRQAAIAHECFDQQQSADPNAETVTRFADQLLHEKNWSAAATEYDRAWQFDPSNPLTLYLSGLALVNSGQGDAGNKKMELAKLLPLGNTALRSKLAEGLNERGMIDAATEQWELILRTGLWGSWEGSQAWAVSDSAANIARQNLESDPLRAAWLLERQVFYLLKTNSAFNVIEHYARHMHLVHKARGLGLLRESRIDEALDEIELSLNARIDQVDSTIDFVLALENKERNEDAQQVFNKTADRFREILRLFPRSSHHHNNLAWLMARCNRELDQALFHATQANQLAADNTNFIDTLAEVHFRSGHHEKAIELMQTALQLDPDSTELQMQLQRFQEAMKQK